MRFTKPRFEAESNVAEAGKHCRFYLHFDPPASPGVLFPNALVVRLSLGSERPYFYQKVELRNALPSASIGPFTLDLPSDLPGGCYTVEAALVGEPCSDPRDLTVGTLEVKAARQGSFRKVLASGNYVDSKGVPHLWSSSPEHAFYWDGDPFMPVSAMLAGPYLFGPKSERDFALFRKDVEAIRSHGLNHLYLYTQTTMERLSPEQWQRVIDYIEGLGMTYVIGYPWEMTKNGAPKLINARPIRVGMGLEMKTKATLPGKAGRVLKTAELGFPIDSNTISSCQAIAIDASGLVRGPVDCSLRRIDSKQAEAVASFGDVPAGGYDVIFLPELQVPTRDMGNPWYNPEEELAQIRNYLVQVRFGPGFRGFIDFGMVNEHGIYNQHESLFIETPEFLKERTEWLKRAHGSLHALGAAWGLTTEKPESFEQAARLYPAARISGTGQTLVLADPVTNHLFCANGKTSPFWLEYLEQRDAVYAAVQEKVCDGVRDVVDVPVTYKRVALTRTYNSNFNVTNRGFDGVGYELYSAKDGLVGYGAGCGYAEVLQSGKSMIGAVTEMSRGFSKEMPANWPDLPSFIQDMTVGLFFDAKQYYLFFFDVLPADMYPRNHLIIDSRMLEWMRLWQEILETHRAVVLSHVPEVYTSWPVPDAWWPRPSERRAGGVNDDAPGIPPAKAPNGIWVLPVNKAATPAPVTFITLSDDPAVSRWAAEFENLLSKKDRQIVFVGLRENPGKLSIDSYFSGEKFEDGNSVCQRLIPTRTSTVLHQDGQGRVWALQDGQLQIVARRLKKNGTLEASLAFAVLPQPRDAARASWQSLLSDELGIQTLAAENGALKGISFWKGNLPAVVMHTTSRAGGETVQLWSRSGKAFRFKKPQSTEWTDVKCGEKAEFIFPPGPGDDLRRGAGLGMVRVEGANADDLGWHFLKSTPQSSGLAAKATELPRGIILPEVEIPDSFAAANIDEERASATLQEAVKAFKAGNQEEAARLLEEGKVLASKPMLVFYDLLQGRILLQEGKAVEAENILRKAQELAPEDKTIVHALGLSLCAQGKSEEGLPLLDLASKVPGKVGNAARQNLNLLKNRP